MGPILGYQPPLGTGDAGSPTAQPYNDAVAAFSDLFSIPNSPGYLLIEKRDLLLEATNNSNTTPEELALAQEAYDQALSNFLTATPHLSTTLDAFLAQADTVMQTANAHVTWVTQQSLNTLAANDAYIRENLISISYYFDNPGEPLPSWLLAKAFPQTASNLKKETREFLDACNAYRDVSWQIATTRDSFFHNFVDYLKNYKKWQNSGNQDDLNQATNSWNAAIQQETNLTNLLTQRTLLGTTIDEAAANYGEPILSAIKATKDWSTFVEELQQPILDALNLAAAQKQAENDAALAAHLAQYPVEATLESVNKLAAYYSDQLESMTLANIYNIDFPVLPSTNATLSISALAKILSQIQLMLSQLSKLIELSDGNLNLFRSRTQNLDILAGTTKAIGSEVFLTSVKAADDAFNVAVSSQNQLQLTSLETILNNYTTLLPQIDNILTNVNEAITSQNYYIAEYSQAFTEIIEAGLSGVSSALFGTKDYFYSSSFWNCWKESPYGTFSGDDTSEQTHAAAENVTVPSGSLLTIPLLSLSPIPQIAVDSEGLPLTDPSSISALNASILEFAKSLAPINDLIQQIKGSTILDLSTIVLANTILPRITSQTFLNLSFILWASNGVRKAINKDRKKQKKAKKALNHLITSLNRFIPKIKNSQEQSSSATFSFAIGVTGIGMDLQPSDLGKIINYLIQSEILSDTIRYCLDRVAMRAGLILAGEIPQGMSSLMGIQPSELYESLGIDVLKNLDEATTKALFLIMAEQLALTAVETPSLLAQAEVLISKLGDKKISKDDLKDLLAMLVMFQQLIYLFLSMLMGSLGGISGTQMLTEIFGKLGGEASGTIKAFEALGFPKNKAIALATALGGDTTTLDNLLQSLGLDKGSSSIILALFAAQKGNISLSLDVPGGPALISAMLQHLYIAGIIVKGQTFNNELINDIIKTIELKATEMQKDILRTELQRIKNLALNKETESQVTSSDYVEPDYDASIEAFLEALHKVFIEPEQITPPKGQPSPYSLIKPSEIFNEITAVFKTTPQSTQDELLKIARNRFAGLDGVSNEQKAALLYALINKQLSMTEAMSLLFLTRLEGLGKLGDGTVMNDIINKLFAESPEAKQAREDAIKQGIIVDATNRRDQIMENILRSFTRILHTIENKQSALVSFERFAKFVENLSNIAKTYSDRLLSPATIILRNFSILTRTSQDRLNQPRTMLGG